MALKENTCPHTETIIVVLDAWEMHEQIGFKCTECGKIINTQTN